MTVPVHKWYWPTYKKEKNDDDSDETDEESNDSDDSESDKYEVNFQN